MGRRCSGRVAMLSVVGMLVASLGACAAPSGGQPGTLAVTLSAPPGVTPSIRVSGPHGYDQLVTGSQTLTGLEAGTYAVTAPPARKPGALVDELFDAAVQGGGDVAVAAGASAEVTVSYLLRPGSGMLWLAEMGSSKIVAFDAGQLAVGGAGVTPARALGLGPSHRPYAIAFDGRGNLWVGTQAGMLLEFTVADLATSGTPAPVVALDTGSTDVNGLAFGDDGWLWAAVHGAVQGYAPDQLLASGVPAAAVALTGSMGVPLDYPRALAFDASGGLWVANDTTVVRFSPAQLAVGGGVDPEVVLASNGTSLTSAWGVAFDAAGSLWVARWNGSRAEKYQAADITVSGTPDPFVTLTGIGVNLLRLAFDNAGDLWVTSSFDPTYSLFDHMGMVAAANLVSSGSPALGSSFTGLGGFDSGGTMAFDPLPVGLVGAP